MCLILEVFHPGRKHTKRNYGLLAAGKTSWECAWCVLARVYFWHSATLELNMYSLFLFLSLQLCPPVQQMSSYTHLSLGEPILDEFIHSQSALPEPWTWPSLVQKSVSPGWPITGKLTQQFLTVWVVYVWGHSACWYTLYFGPKADISNSIHHIWLSYCVCVCVCVREALRPSPAEPLTSPDRLRGCLPSFGETVNSTFTSSKKNKTKMHC